LKEEPKVVLSPLPQSGGFSSMLLGFIAVLGAWIIIQESTIPLHSNFTRKSNNDQGETEINWQSKPLIDSNLKPKYVESNPNVPENPPDEVKQFSFRDQQAAQPEIKKTTQEKKVPKIKSNDNNPKIIAAKKKVNEVVQSPPPKLSDSNHKKKSTQEPKTLIFSKTEIQKPKEKEGSYSKKNVKDGLDKEKIIIASIQNPSMPSSLTTIPPQKPRQKIRPSLSSDLIHGPLMRSTTSAPRVGEIAIECRLHPFGVYIQEMLQSIEEQWNQLASGSIQYLQRDRLPGKITLRFKIEASGDISNLSRVDNEGYSLAAELCRQAIASRVPFGKWTEKMIKDFGQSDEITLNFQYR